MKIQNIVPVFLFTTLVLAGCQKPATQTEIEVLQNPTSTEETTLEAEDGTTSETEVEGEVVSYDGEYILNTQASTVEWVGKKVGGQHNGTVDVQSGNFTVVNGIGNGEFVLDMTTINTLDLEGAGKERMDGHLKNEDFFHVEAFPTATFVLKDIEVTTQGPVGVVGDLTIKGITNPVAFMAEFSQAGEQTMVMADFSLDRTLWDIRYGSLKFFSDIADSAIDDMMSFSLDLVFVGPLSSLSVADTAKVLSELKLDLSDPKQREKAVRMLREAGDRETMATTKKAEELGIPLQYKTGGGAATLRGFDGDQPNYVQPTNY